MRAKTPTISRDFRIFGARNGEIGAGWVKTGKVSGKEYVSLTLAHPMIGPRKVYANMGANANGEKGEYVLLWNPAA